MPDDSKKIFVTYRRALSTDFVHRLRDHLKARDFDVFVDVQSIPSGRFADTILHQIEARPHFLAILVPGSLERTTEEDDWYRREVEHALRTKRNIIPVLAKGFSFADEHQRLRRKTLPGRLDELKQYQHFSFIYEYDEQFQANIDVLVKRFLVIPEETQVVPTPRHERETVREMLKIADLAKADRSGSDWILPLHSRFLFTRLSAPKLAEPAHGKFTWTPVAGASGYLLQAAWDEAFSKPEDLYTGNETEFFQPSRFSTLTALGLADWKNPLSPRPGLTPSIVPSPFASSLFGTRYYRVKAQAGLGRLDSSWSNVVKVEPPRLPLPAPRLDRASIQLFTSKFSWTAVEGAVGYTLQVSRDEGFSEPENLYEGEKTEFEKPSGLFGPLTLDAGKGFAPSLAAGLLSGAISGARYYRVKAKAGPDRLDSPWSNVVKAEPPKPLPAPRLEQPSNQIFKRKFSWTAVQGAAGYLLQASTDEAFSESEDLYSGPATEFADGGEGFPWADVTTARVGKLPGSFTKKPASEPWHLIAEDGVRYYRVKARAGPGRLDSPWSNVVKG